MIFARKNVCLCAEVVGVAESHGVVRIVGSSKISILPRHGKIWPKLTKALSIRHNLNTFIRNRRIGL